MREAEFLRTPKTAERARWWDAIRGNVGETVLALLGAGGIVGALAAARSYPGLVTAGLLLWPTVAFASAPLNSLSAQRAALPTTVRARRSTEYRRAGGMHPATVTAGGLAAVAAVVALVVGLLAPAGGPSVAPNLVGPARGHGARRYSANQTSRTQPGGSSPQPSPSPSTSPSTSPSPTPTATPSTGGPTPTAPASASATASP